MTRLFPAAALLLALLGGPGASAFDACVQIPELNVVDPGLPLYCGDTRNGNFLALDVHHLIRNSESGAVLEPVVLRKQIDDSSIPLWAKLNDGSAFQTVKVYIMIQEFGLPETYLTLELEGATVDAIEPITSTEMHRFQERDLERIRLGYSAVTIEYPGGGSVRLVNGGRQ